MELVLPRQVKSKQAPSGAFLFSTDQFLTRRKLKQGCYRLEQERKAFVCEAGF